MPLSDGETFAGFTILRLLDSDDTGEIYLAEHPRFEHRVALRLVAVELSADAGLREGVTADLQSAATLEHPNILGVLDWGEADGRLWLATQYVDGSVVLDAGQLLRDEFPDGMPRRSVATIVAYVADALDYAHQHGVLHRHLTPATVWVADPFSDTYRILVTGFGTARLANHGDPDGAAGPPADGRTDQYGLAATAVQLLTGAPPSADAGPVFAKALADDPAARYASCGEFAAALAEPATTHRPPIVKATRSPAEPAAETTPAKLPLRKILVPTATALLLAAAVTVALVLFDKPRTTREEPQTVAQLPATTSPATAAVSPLCAEVDALSIRDKLAQLLMVGVTGLADARAVVDTQHVGGIFISSWTDMSMLGDPLAEIAGSTHPLPLAVSVDEEGGRVARLTRAGLLGAQPSPRVLAATKTEQEVHDIAYQRGVTMKQLGITVDFAPVVDVTSESDDEVIGDRSFGADPAVVTTFAGAYAQGLRDAGLLPVLKHFPGHGHGSGDSHQGGVTTPPLEQLMNDDLIPYRTLTAQQPVAVMLGHLQVPGLTGTDPASLSPAAYDLLRTGGYGGPAFDGLVYTDDLSSMAAITSRYGVAEAVLKALQAGVDVALWVSTDQVPAVLDRLEQAHGAGELSQDRINAALRHVITAKQPGVVCPG